MFELGNVLNNSVNSYFRNTKINNNTNITSPRFCGIQSLKQDKVEFSDNIHKVKIKDTEGKEVDAMIVETASKFPDITNNGKKFELFVNGKKLGYADVCDNNKKDTLELVYLYTQEHENRTYKGAGSELLKCAVKESIKRGYNGKIRVNASHSAYSPLAFYYKNNFIIEKLNDSKRFGYIQRRNGAIQYAIENNIPVDNVLLSIYRNSFMKLDENGAKAFLEGKRLYKDRTFEKLAEKNIDGINYSANLIQSPYDNEYFLLIADETSEKDKAVFDVTLAEKQSPNGKKHFEICDISEYTYAEKEQIDFALETIENAAKQKSFEQTTIDSKINKDSFELYKESSIKLPME